MAVYGLRLRAFALLLAARLLLCSLLQSAFVPDEYWQGPEVAHRIAFARGQLTWEWQPAAQLRSALHPALLAAVYRLLHLGCALLSPLLPGPLPPELSPLLPGPLLPTSLLPGPLLPWAIVAVPAYLQGAPPAAAARSPARLGRHAHPETCPDSRR